MKKIIVILLVIIASTSVGLYFRPSFFLVGKLDWFNVLTKGAFEKPLSTFFSQGYIDESFWFVMKFSGGGLLFGILLSFFVGGGVKSSKPKK
jgi:hypothetical protein